MADDTAEINQSRNSSIKIEPPNIKIPAKMCHTIAPVHPSLPQLPFYVGIIGPRHTGKSVFLYSILRDAPGTYGAAFKKSNIILFSPTKDKDPTLKPLKLKYAYGPPFNPQTMVNNVLDQQKTHAGNDNQTGVLLVWDDITQIREAWKPLEDLAYYGRHDQTHVLYVAHKMSSIPRGVRTQTQQWILFKPHEESERQWIMDMFSRKRTREIWEMALLRCWSIKYNFAYIDFEQEEPDMIYRSGLENPLFYPEEMAIITGEGDMDYYYDPTTKERIPIQKHSREFVTEHDTPNEEDVQPPKRKRQKKQ